MIGKEELEAVTRVIESGVLSGFRANASEGHAGGVEVRALEKEWRERFGVKHAIAVNSNSSGLYCAMAAVGIKPGDEVIVSPYTMTISATVPLLFEAVPVFADIERKYYCLNPKSVEARITPKTKAIIVVDLFGLPYDADALNEIAAERGIYVIEDAAQAIGAAYKGRYAGTLGDIGVFSLNVHKHIQCGEGGVVVTDDDYLAERVRLMRNHAEAVIHDRFRRGENFNKRNVSMSGMNLRMTELDAAVARAQLSKLDRILKSVRIYAEPFNVPIRPGCTHSYYVIPVSKHGIKYKPDRVGYIKPIYRMPVFQSRGYPINCPVCEEVEANIAIMIPKF